ncbi:MAG: mechanosensitive ion channel domain-containing protein [Phycisphaerales bacterium JB054]
MRTPNIALALVLVLLSLLVPPALAQPDGVPTTIEEIKAALSALGDDVSGAPLAETSDETIKAYRLALEAANAAEASRTQAATFRALADAAPDLVRQYRQELDTAPSKPEISVPAGATLADLELALAQATSDLAAAQSDIDTLRLETPRRSDRARAIPALITAAQTDIERLQAELDTPAPAEMAPARATARQVRIAAQLSAAQARVVELRAEADSYNARSELLPLRISRAERRVTQAQELVTAWQQVVGTRRQQDARDAARQASERDLTQAEQIPALAPIAAQIRELVDDLQGTDAAPAREAQASRRLTEMNIRLQERRQDDFEIRSRARTQASNAFGQMLQSTLRKLRDARTIRRQLDNTQSAELDVTLRLEEVKALAKIATDTGIALEEVREQLGEDAATHEALAKRLIEQRRTLAGQSRETLTTLLDTLTELAAIYTDYLQITDSLQDFIRARVFWVRSVPRDRLVPQAADFAFDIGWLTNDDAWRTALLAGGRQVVRAIDPPTPTRATPRPLWHYLVMPICAAVLITSACLGRWRLIVRSRAPLPKTGRFQTGTMAGTFLKLGLTLVAAIPLPLAIWVIGVWLGSTSAAFTADTSTSAPVAIGSGLSRAAFVLFVLSLLRGLTRRSGVGVTQFRWSETGLAHFRFHLRWMTPVGVIIAATVQTFEVRADDLHPEALGRASLAFGLLAVAVFQWRVFSPKRPFIGEYIKKHRRGVIERSSWFWFPLVVCLPVLLAVGTAAGFVYTALQIQRTVGNTYLIVLVVLVGQGLVLRTLQLARRRIAIEAARARAAAAEAEAETARQSPGDAPTPKEPEPPLEIDLTTISLQSRKVVQMVTVVVLTVGLYAVWNDVLPALKWFERLQVFPSLQYIDPDTELTGAGTLASAPAVSEQSGSAAGTTPTPGMIPSTSSAASDESSSIAALPSRVTVADIGLAILLLVLTVSASRNLPGLLEITLLPHLPLDSATRYAIFSIARYLLIIVGVVAISKTLSIPWRSAQWLAAALTFGLAFGMQEIFANFVAGIIMLFEQPVRVGDTVTIGNISGEVSRIRMRATTIIDWDNKELIIPNKTFITDQVINWTLRDPIMRVVIPVGIAYGSDTERARELLLKAAEECEFTIDFKPARALFVGFGDNSLNFSLRVFIDTINNLMAATSDLHFRIDREFRAAGIEISFPQRDLHIRSLDPAILEQIGVSRVSPERPQTKEDGAS